jgi:hypothetical protein
MEILQFLLELLTYNNPDVISMDFFGIGTLLGSGINAGVAAAQNKKQRRHEKQMAETAWDREVSMWNAQNEYNSPVEQMKRFEEAGLNPHLAVTGGNPGNATGMPSYQKPGSKFGIPAIEIPNIISNIFSFKKMKKELQQMDINRWISEEHLRQNDLKSILMDYMVAIQPQKYDYQTSYYKERTAQEKAATVLKRNEAELSNLRLNRIKKTGGDILRDNRMYRAIDQLIERLIDNAEQIGQDQDKFMDLH